MGLFGSLLNLIGKKAPEPAPTRPPMPVSYFPPAPMSTLDAPIPYEFPAPAPAPVPVAPARPAWIDAAVFDPKPTPSPSAVAVPMPAAPPVASGRMDDDAYLTPNFKRRDFWHSDTAVAHGIDNRPTDAVWDNIERMAPKIQKLRDKVGLPIFISSGYRSPKVNALVGGVWNSAHLDGLGFDLQCPGRTPRQLEQAWVELGLPYDQLIHESASGGAVVWLHVGGAAVGVAPRYQRLGLNV